MKSRDLFLLRRQIGSSLCNRQTSAKLWRNTLRATEFQPESIMKIRKRGGSDGLDLRGRARTGSSMTAPSFTGGGFCGIGGRDPDLVFAIAYASVLVANQYRVTSTLNRQQRRLPDRGVANRRQCRGRASSQAPSRRYLTGQ